MMQWCRWRSNRGERRCNFWNRLQRGGRDGCVLPPECWSPLFTVCCRVDDGMYNRVVYDVRWTVVSVEESRRHDDRVGWMDWCTTSSLQ